MIRLIAAYGLHIVFVKRIGDKALAGPTRLSHMVMLLPRPFENDGILFGKSTVTANTRCLKSMLHTQNNNKKFQGGCTGENEDVLRSRKLRIEK